MPTRNLFVATLACFISAACATGGAAEPQPPSQRWLAATAHAVPKETATEGEGYFAIVAGRDGRLYIGTHANAVNSWLVEFTSSTKQMKIVVDAHQAIGKDIKGFGAQSKIHTRNNVGPSGKIYFATKQGYPDKNEKRTDYPGGYPMVYDPATGKTQVYPIPVPHQGIISIIADESRGLAYLSTCSDERPIESTHFVVLDLKTGRYRDLLDCRHMYAFVVLDHLGRAYHPMLGGDIVRYDPRTQKVERLKQTIDGAAPTADSHLADPEAHPINWDTSPDGKTLYAVAMSTNKLYAYDLTGEGDVLRGRTLGELIPGAKGTDCRGMCVGPKGVVWASVTEARDGVQWHHLVRYSPGDAAPRDLGLVKIANPDYTPLVDSAGKPLPYHGGVFKLADGVMTTRHVTLGVCENHDGRVYALAIQPYTLLEIDVSR